MTPPDSVYQEPNGEVCFCKHCDRYFVKGDEIEYVGYYNPYKDNFVTTVDECPECKAELDTCEEEMQNPLIEHHEKKLQTALAILEIHKQADRKIELNKEYIEHSKDWRKWVTFPNLVKKAQHSIEITTLAKQRIQKKYNSIIKEVSNGNN